MMNMNKNHKTETSVFSLQITAILLSLFTFHTTSFAETSPSTIPQNEAAVESPTSAPKMTESEASAPTAASSAVSKSKEKIWETMSDDDGIKTYRRDIEGSALVAFKGESIIEASLPKIAQILSDTSKKLEWVAKVKEAKNIQVFNDLERIEYNQTTAPWPVSNRDFVFRAKAEVDKIAKTVTLRIHSVEHPDAPERDCCVRGFLEESLYVIRVIDSKRTYLSVEINADPKGSLPKWVVNLFQKSWPRKTIEGIKAQAAKPEVPEHPYFKKIFDEVMAEGAAATPKL